jgi:putative peptide zinc metalloprotease protein
MRRRLLTYIAVAATGFSLAAGPAQAADTTAVALNTKDDSTLVDIVFKIVKVVNGNDVTASNAAAAVASCDSCSTMAVAIQIVLASGSPDVVIPQNLAIAMNIDCNLCQTFADAYQYVYAGDTRLTFTDAGKARIKEIQKQLHDLEKSGLPLDQIQARVEELTAQIQQIVNTELVAFEPGASGDAGQPASPAQTTPTETTPTQTTPSDTGTQTTPTDTGTGTSTTPTDTGTETTPTDTGTGTSTTPTDTGTQTTPTDTGTSPTPSGG